MDTCPYLQSIKNAAAKITLFAHHTPHVTPSVNSSTVQKIQVSCHHIKALPNSALLSAPFTPQAMTALSAISQLLPPSVFSHITLMPEVPPLIHTTVTLPKTHLCTDAYNLPVTLASLQGSWAELKLAT